MKNNQVPTYHEGMIVSGLSQYLDMITFISEDTLGKKIRIFVEHFILSLRELSFYAEKYFSEALTDQHRNQMGHIKSIRDAICHRSSSQNLLNPHLYLSGGFNFKNDDVEVQYGKTKMVTEKIRERFQEL